MLQADVVATAHEAHERVFGSCPHVKAWAPGRIEVLGNHTDYNEGTVLSAAIDLGHCVALSPATRPGIRLQAVDVCEVAEFTAAEAHAGHGPGWSHYVKGVCHLLQQRLGVPIDGLDLSFYGSIPMGAGLSSSAALEVSTATALLGWVGRTLDRKEIAQLCRQAEHDFAGTNCGLLDQFSSLFGQPFCLIHSDFRSLDVSALELPHDMEFLVVNPRVKHRLADSPYNERRERCEQAARALATLLPHPVTGLRDVSWADFQACRSEIDPAAARRAAHVIGEIERVAQAMDFIRSGDMGALGACLFASHESSVEYFENSCTELDQVVASARRVGALGARLSGGGFGGSAIVLVRKSEASAVAEALAADVQTCGLVPEILAVIPSGGAGVLPE